MLACGLTYSGHSVACAAAVATINIYKSDKLIENSANMGAKLEKTFQKFSDKHPSLGEARGKGLHWCLELVKNKKTREELSEWNKPMSKPMTEVSAFLKQNGISTFVRWNQVYVCPPLCINEKQLDDAMEIYDRALDIADKGTV
jgi:taurine--2-oxoglutarate transaminase